MGKNKMGEPSKHFGSDARLGLFVALAIASVVISEAMHRPIEATPIKQSNPTLEARVSAMELANANAGVENKMEKAPAGAATEDSVQNVRKMVEELPTKEYVDDQINVSKRQAKACGDAATALQGALTTITKSGIATLDASSIKSTPAKIDDLSRKITDAQKALKEMGETAESEGKQKSAIMEDLSLLKKKQATQMTEDQVQSVVATAISKIATGMTDVQIKGMIAAEKAKWDVSLEPLATKADLLESANGVKKNLAEIKSAFDGVAGEMDGAKQDIAALKGRLGGLDANLTTLAGNQEKLARSYTSLYGCVKDLIGKVKTENAPQ